MKTLFFLFFWFINLVFFQSPDFTRTQNDKQEQERVEKYFIRASIEAVTTQIHPLLSVRIQHTHAHIVGMVGGLCIRAEEL